MVFARTKNHVKFELSMNRESRVNLHLPSTIYNAGLKHGLKNRFLLALISFLNVSFDLQVFAIIRYTDNPQMFALEFIRGTTKKFMSTDRSVKCQCQLTGL